MQQNKTKQCSDQSHFGHVKFADHFNARGNVSTHAHPVLELIYVCRGKCTSNLESLPLIHAEEGMCFVIPPYMPHDQCGDCDTLFLNMILPQQEYPLQPGLIDLKTDPFLSGWFSDVVKLFQQMSYRETDLLAQAIWSRVRHLHLKAVRNADPMVAYTAFAIDYIHRHYAMPLTVERLAREARISQGYLNRCFRSEYGVSTMRYLYDFRLQVSCRLLNSPYLSIAEVAENCGFSGANYFCRAFHKKYGMTPGEYRVAVRHREKS